MSKILHRGGRDGDELVVGEFMFWELMRYLKEVAQREPEKYPLFEADGVTDAQFTQYYFGNEFAEELARELPTWGEEFDKVASEAADPQMVDWCRGMAVTCRRVAEWSKGGAWLVEV
jgi:hypothetical protein